MGQLWGIQLCRKQQLGQASRSQLSTVQMGWDWQTNVQRDSPPWQPLHGRWLKFGLVHCLHEWPTVSRSPGYSLELRTQASWHTAHSGTAGSQHHWRFLSHANVTMQENRWKKKKENHNRKEKLFLLAVSLEWPPQSTFKVVLAAKNKCLRAQVPLSPCGWIRSWKEGQR